MDKLFNWISVAGGVIGGFLSLLAGRMGRAAENNRIPGSFGLHNWLHQSYLQQAAVI